tara:strand:+ start:29 stop:877 length:849 start_codon:yes stop_codon:yes gene_type:complete
MKISKIKSPAKINLSLNVLKKLKSGYHQIETLVTFTDLNDDIFIREIKADSHKVKFYGNFSNGIYNNNTVTNLLKVLDKRKKLNNKKFLIKIKKNIPCKAGLGGGSINSGSILKHFITKKIVKCKNKEIIDISNEIGSDVIFGLQKKKIVVLSKKKISSSNKKLGLHLVICKPNFGCSSGLIYKKLKNYNKKKLNKNINKNITLKSLINFNNNLEISAFNLYPKLKQMKSFMSLLDNVLFVRMTGSGSSMVAYFNSKKSAIYAKKILEKKYKNYWCILSKTI